MSYRKPADCQLWLDAADAYPREPEFREFVQFYYGEEGKAAQMLLAITSEAIDFNSGKHAYALTTWGFSRLVSGSWIPCGPNTFWREFKKSFPDSNLTKLIKEELNKIAKEILGS